MNRHHHPPPRDVIYTTGEVASIQVSVPALHGCKAGAPVDNCVMVTPIAVSLGSVNKSLFAVRWVPLWVTQDANGHSGRLIGKNYVVSSAETGTGWTIGTPGTGLVSVRLSG